MGLVNKVFGLLTSWLVLPDLRPLYNQMDVFHKLLFLVSLLTLLEVLVMSNFIAGFWKQQPHFDQQLCNMS